MARMYTNGHGKSRSSIPYSRAPCKPTNTTVEEVKNQIVALSRRGVLPSKIGIMIRDMNGVGKIEYVTGSKVIRILRAEGLAPKYPEDLYCLMKRAVSIRKHLDQNRRDKDAKYRLICTESRIHRLVRYYISVGKLPASFRYTGKAAPNLVAAYQA